MSEAAEPMDPLSMSPIGKTLARFAVPAIISNLITSIYNITDQIFIGQNVGIPGNAATNVAFLVSIICTAVAILFGFGGVARLNLEMGRGNREKGPKIVGTTFGRLRVLIQTALVLDTTCPSAKTDGDQRSCLCRPYGRWGHVLVCGSDVDH